MKWALATLLLTLSAVTNGLPVMERVMGAPAASDCCGESREADSTHERCRFGCGLDFCLCSTCPLRAALPPTPTLTVVLAPITVPTSFPPVPSPMLEGSTRRVFHPPKV